MTVLKMQSLACEMTTELSGLQMVPPCRSPACLGLWLKNRVVVTYAGSGWAEDAICALVAVYWWFVSDTALNCEVGGE